MYKIDTEKKTFETAILINKETKYSLFTILKYDESLTDQLKRYKECDLVAFSNGTNIADTIDTIGKVFDLDFLILEDRIVITGKYELLVDIDFSNVIYLISIVNRPVLNVNKNRETIVVSISMYVANKERQVARVNYYFENNYSFDNIENSDILNFGDFSHLKLSDIIKKEKGM